VKPFSIFRAKQWPDPITIGITTFEKRFERYFVPLVEQLRAIDNETEIVVAVNGEHQQPFSEPYRSSLLSFIAGKPRIFPIFFPQFRGLSKLWNSIIIHASSEHILLLNDDVAINRKKFLQEVKKALYYNRGRSFTINHSWSHFLVRRDEIDRLGFFDERLLGIGEEDGDMTWRYQSHYGEPVADFSISGIINYSEATMTEKPLNISCHGGGKYSRFNRQFVYEQKYQKDPQGQKGIFDAPMIMKDPGQKQYPMERFYRENKEKM
jgi:hypothetical protein